MDMCLKRLIEMKGSWADRALKWMIGSCRVIIRHHLGSKTMDDSGVELVSVREVEIEPGTSA